LSFAAPGLHGQAFTLQPAGEHPSRYEPRQRAASARFDLLVEIIERETGDDPQALAPWSRGPGRKLMADLGHEECGLTFEALAEVLRTSPWVKLGSGLENQPFNCS
jgi:hypothetical protein